MCSDKVQWFPGHMHKAIKAIKKANKQVDVFIELLDARIPFSSANPMLAEIRNNKPVVKVCTRLDQADPELNLAWQKHFAEQTNTRSLMIDARKKGASGQIPGLCRDAYRANGGAKTILSAMVVGIPNVGKSTLINTMAGRKVAKTGNEPAVTKSQQTIEIEHGFVLLDTPGVMWPNVENRNSGYRLAVTGAIKDTALSHEEVAIFAIGFFLESYGDRLITRYKLNPGLSDPSQVLVEIGQRRGCLLKGGIVDLDRAAKILLADIRDGRLGRFTMETPKSMREELKELASTAN